MNRDKGRDLEVTASQSPVVKTSVRLCVTWPGVEEPWEPYDTANLDGWELLKWSKAHFDLTGDGHAYYLLVRHVDGTSQRVKDDDRTETLPRIAGVVRLILVRVLGNA